MEKTFSLFIGISPNCNLPLMNKPCLSVDNPVDTVAICEFQSSSKHLPCQRGGGCFVYVCKLIPDFLRRTQLNCIQDAPKHKSDTVSRSFIMGGGYRSSGPFQNDSHSTVVINCTSTVTVPKGVAGRLTLQAFVGQALIFPVACSLLLQPFSEDHGHWT